MLQHDGCGRDVGDQSHDLHHKDSERHGPACVTVRRKRRAVSVSVSRIIFFYLVASQQIIGAEGAMMFVVCAAGESAAAGTAAAAPAATPLGLRASGPHFNIRLLEEGPQRAPFPLPCLPTSGKLRKNVSKKFRDRHAKAIRWSTWANEGISSLKNLSGYRT